MENVSPGPASSVGSETDPFPAASCALTIRVMLRIFFWLELRKDSAAFTSIKFAPRVVALELPKSSESRLIGESLTAKNSAIHGYIGSPTSPTVSSPNRIYRYP